MTADDRNLGRGTVWVGIASGLAGVLDLITTVACLWLWISPADLGVATLAGALLPVIERVAGLGMPAALVRFADAERRALSTMIWLNVVGALAVLGAAIAGRGVIGRALGEPIVGGLVIGYAAKLVVQTTYVAPEAMLRRALAFDRLTRVRIAASFTEAAVKLGCAYAGAHVWCFVAGPLANGVVTALAIQLARPWRPVLAFDRQVARDALRYGVQVSGGELLYFLYSNADYLVIGRVWGGAAVGAYRLAYELVLDVVRLISLVTAEVAFPAFARVRGDRARAGELLIRFTRQNAIALAPVLVFLAVAADDLLAVLYPPLPAAAVSAARLLCIVGGLRVLSFVFPAMLAGLGHAGDALAYHALAALLLPLAFVAAAWAFPAAGFLAVAAAWAVAYPVVFFVLLGRTLVRCHVGLAAYLRSLAGIVASGGLAAAVGLAAHVGLGQLGALAIVRLLVTAAVVLAVDLAALARIERVTPRSVLRAIRGGA
ncbi:MAG TPA: oligosaccharide flippase family protein [Kofleriaceae bacterium]|nr:oligosaccharide flippase family protein [Kofleriaceae bacterium]